MHKNATKCNKTQSKWCINKHGVSKIIDTFETYQLPRIDQVIDFTAGYNLLLFLDAYSGYHQIPLYEPDEIKTSFITPYGAYCYVTMPFGLNNAEATYQRTMQ
jgi:hypothetical protein